MTEEVAFIIARRKSDADVLVKIPVTAAIVTVLFLGASRHHSAACGVVGELAMVITQNQLEANLDKPLLQGAAKTWETLNDNRHKPKVSRFSNDGLQLTGRISPTELYAMGISVEGFLDDIGEDEPSVYNSLETWARGASRFVREREMLAIYEKEGLA